MTLNEIAKAIGIKKYDEIPEGMFAYYPIPENRKPELCSMEMICRVQEKFDFFGEYFDAAKKSWEAMEQDELRKTWTDVSSLYMIDNEYEKITKIPVPEPDGTKAGDLIQLFIHVPSVETAYEMYLARGFDEETSKGIMHRYYGSLRHTSEDIIGRPAMIGMYFRWDCLYTKARLFAYRGFNFELHKSRLANVIRNRRTGEVLPLAVPGVIHRSGEVLGSAGMEDEEGSFAVDFTETDAAFIGHPARNCYFGKEPETFSKEEWEQIFRPGDAGLNIHIPKKTDFSEENITLALEGAKKIAAEGFKEYSPKVFLCSSWLLSPQLDGMLKPGSRILGFAERFVRFPRKSGGKSVFSFVFPQNFKGTYEQLPEDTSLMRALKQWYLDGKFIYDYSGVIPM